MKSSLRELLTCDVDVDAKDRNGDTALIKAAEYGSTAALNLLLPRGSDVDATNKGEPQIKTIKLTLLNH